MISVTNYQNSAYLSSGSQNVDLSRNTNYGTKPQVFTTQNNSLGYTNNSLQMSVNLNKSSDIPQNFSISSPTTSLYCPMISSILTPPQSGSLASLSRKESVDSSITNNSLIIKLPNPNKDSNSITTPQIKSGNPLNKYQSLDEVSYQNYQNESLIQNESQIPAPHRLSLVNSDISQNQNNLVSPTPTTFFPPLPQHGGGNLYHPCVQYQHHYNQGIHANAYQLTNSYNDVLQPIGNLQTGLIDESGENNFIGQNNAHLQQNHFHHHHHNGNIFTKKERPSSMSKTNIYIRGLDENTTDEDLQEMCQKYGEIKSTKAIIEKQTNKCKGYGFVDYKTPDEALNALNEMKKEQKDVQLAKQREQDPTNLYFANLPGDIDEKQLTELLKIRFNATVNSTRVMREKTGNSKGIGFARIDLRDTCEKIIKELNGQSFPDHENKSKILLVKLADSGTNFKIGNKSSFKNAINNINKLPTIDDASSNGYLPNMPQYIDPMLNNGYPIQIYDSSQVTQNSPYMHLVHHQIPQQPSLPPTPQQSYNNNIHSNNNNNNNNLTQRSAAALHQPQRSDQQGYQSNMNTMNNSNIYYTNNPALTLPPLHHHHHHIPAVHHLPYIFVPASQDRQQNIGHYNQIPNNSIYDKNNNNIIPNGQSIKNLTNNSVSNIDNKISTNSIVNSNPNQQGLSQNTPNSNGHIIVSAVHGQNQQYQI